METRITNSGLVAIASICDRIANSLIEPYIDPKEYQLKSGTYKRFNTNLSPKQAKARTKSKRSKQQRKASRK